MGAVTFSLDLRLVQSLREGLALDIFVETGTYQGETLEMVREFFKECHSVELSETAAAAARLRLGEYENVHIECGDSPDFLERMEPKLREESVLYFLDAHWCEGTNTAGALSQCPLLAEISAIGRLNARSVLIIDDARLFLAPPLAPHEVSQWPRLPQIIELLEASSSEHELMVLNDVFLYFPKTISERMQQFAHENGSDWLAIQHSARHEPELRRTILETETAVALVEKQAAEAMVALSEEHEQVILRYREKIRETTAAYEERLLTEKTKKDDLRAKLRVAKDKIEALKSPRPKKRKSWSQRLKNLFRKPVPEVPKVQPIPKIVIEKPPVASVAPVATVGPVVEAKIPSPPIPEIPVAVAPPKPAIMAPPVTETPSAYADIAKLSSAAPPKVVFDVGANEGQTMLQMVELFPEAQVHSFEPFPAAYDVLQEQARRFSQAHTHRMAIGERDGESLLFLSQASVTNSLLPTAASAADYSPAGWTDAVGTLKVEISTLDRFLATQQIERIDVLKIDAQGYELQILQGSESLLSAGRIGFIYLELIFVPLYDGQASFEKIYGLLRGYSYQLIDLYEKNVGPDGTLRWCNALFRRENEAPLQGS